MAVDADDAGEVARCSCTMEFANGWSERSEGKVEGWARGCVAEPEKRIEMT